MATPGEIAPTPTPSSAPMKEGMPWVSITWFIALAVVCYGSVLQRLVANWISDEDMGHGFFVPVVAGYIAWQRRDELLAMVPRGSNLGLVLVAWGAFQLWVATLGAELFLQRTAIVFTLSGIVLFLLGWEGIRKLAFPLALLLFMVPLPKVIYNQITFPLQLFASRVAETVLMVLGIPVLREGNVLELASQKLSVVEACSGIRSLLSLTFLSLVYGFFFETKTWLRWTLLAATVPIAITANSTRVTITGILSEYKKELAEGFFHSLEGWVIFMVALVMLVGFHQFMNWMYKGIKNARANTQNNVS